MAVNLPQDIRTVTSGAMTYIMSDYGLQNADKRKSYTRSNSQPMAKSLKSASLAFHDFTRIDQTRRSISVKLIGPGILTEDGSSWKRARDLIKPIFSRAELSDITFIEKHVSHLLRILPRDGSTTDAQAVLLNLVNSSTNFALLIKYADRKSVSGCVK